MLHLWTHHEVDVAVIVDEVLHQLLKAVPLSAHLRRNRNVSVSVFVSSFIHTQSFSSDVKLRMRSSRVMLCCDDVRQVVYT